MDEIFLFWFTLIINLVPYALQGKSAYYIYSVLLDFWLDFLSFLLLGLVHYKNMNLSSQTIILYADHWT